jgi:hypothetical protein
MRLFTVRSGMASVALAALLSGIAPLPKIVAAEQTQDRQLNLVFHGLFGYVIWPDRIEVLAPDVNDHVYKAGTWGKELRLKQGTTYRLGGVVASATSPAIDRKNNLVFRTISEIDRSPSKIFCSFSLPLPASMSGLRHAPNTKARPFFSGPASANLAIDSLPMIQTLVFHVQDIHQLGFGTALSWTPQIAKDGTVNLHIWAEPDADPGEPHPNHAPMAFNQLMSLFPQIQLQLEFGAGTVQPDKTVAIKGVSVWEQWSLVERNRILFPPRALKAGKGAEVSNCIGIIIDNSTP